MRWLTVCLFVLVDLACHEVSRSNIRLGDGTRYVNNTGEAQWVLLPDSSRIKLGSGTSVVVGAEFDQGFRVDAVRTRPGEEVDLLAGQLTIRKSYPSDLDSLPEDLASGDMLMINRE